MSNQSKAINERRRIKGLTVHYIF